MNCVSAPQGSLGFHPLAVALSPLLREIFPLSRFIQ